MVQGNVVTRLVNIMQKEYAIPVEYIHFEVPKKQSRRKKAH